MYMYSLSICVSPDLVRAREWLCLVGLFCGVNLESLLMATSPLSILNIMHPRRLTNTFVVRFWESIISKLATSKISFFHLVSVAEESSSSFALPETQKTGFVASRFISKPPSPETAADVCSKVVILLLLVGCLIFTFKASL